MLHDLLPGGVHLVDNGKLHALLLGIPHKLQVVLVAHDARGVGENPAKDVLSLEGVAAVSAVCRFAQQGDSQRDVLHDGE